MRCLKNKWEARDHLIDLMEEFHNQYGRYPKQVRMDEAGETRQSVYFNSWCVDRGIKVAGPPPYTHESNGKIEKALQDNERVAISMMYHAGAAKGMWELAAMYAAEIHQYIPSLATKEQKTPFEIFEGRCLPDLRFIKPFGCEAIMHVQVEKQSKMEPKAIKGIFVGVKPEQEAWLVMVPGGKIFTSRNVKFAADVFPWKKDAAKEIEESISEDYEFEFSNEIETDEEELKHRDDPKALPTLVNGNRVLEGAGYLRQQTFGKINDNSSSQPDLLSQNHQVYDSSSSEEELPRRKVVTDASVRVEVQRRQVDGPSPGRRVLVPASTSSRIPRTAKVLSQVRTRNILNPKQKMAR